MSRPFGYDTPTLSGILLNARTNNARDDITGALICRHDIYLQMLEGPESKVNAAYARICRDDRHLEIKTIVSEPVPSRIFEQWAMLHDPAKSLIWTKEEIEDGAIERAGPANIRKMFEALRDAVKEGAAD